MDTSPLPICIGPTLLGLVIIYLVAHHHLGGYLCLSQERNSVWLPTDTPVWIIIHSMVSFRKKSQVLHMTGFIQDWTNTSTIRIESGGIKHKDCSALDVCLFFVANVTVHLGLCDSPAVITNVPSHTCQSLTSICMCSSLWWTHFKDHHSREWM